ncbi:NTP_transf_3 domain-containing protein [Tenacibaculum sp. 190130A14a]|uniref:Molybdenum cofactor cytidylyltransferase n=1 Tax=Tenacibaculum polynesiense TaxID=3137857 RepID=A0ABP1EWU3_9FLAO
MQNTAIIILAAGSASRMGAIKQLLPYKNTTLLGWAIQNAVQSNAKATFCVLGANATQIIEEIKQSSIPIIINAEYKDGLSSSIASGIEHIENRSFDHVLIMLADQPNVNTDYLNTLLNTSQEHPHNIIASDYGKNVGVPAIFPKAYFQNLTKLKGDKGAKLFLQHHLSEVMKIKTIDLIDIDTKEEYQRLIN